MRSNNAIRVGILNKNGEVTEIFESEKAAAIELNVSSSSIRNAVKRGTKVRGVYLTEVTNRRD